MIEAFWWLVTNLAFYYTHRVFSLLREILQAGFKYKATVEDIEGGLTPIDLTQSPNHMTGLKMF